MRWYPVSPCLSGWEKMQTLENRIELILGQIGLRKINYEPCVYDVCLDHTLKHIIVGQITISFTIGRCIILLQCSALLPHSCSEFLKMLLIPVLFLFSDRVGEIWAPHGYSGEKKKKIMFNCPAATNIWAKVRGFIPQESWSQPAVHLQGLVFLA